MTTTSPSNLGYVIVPSPGHMLQGHPESPERFGLFESLFQLPISARLKALELHSDPTEQILKVHDRSYVDLIREASARAPTIVDSGDTYVTKASYESALEAVGGALALVNSIVADEPVPGFALVRPPGHHASADKAGGFCLFNNIGIAANHATQLGFGKVMIVDFDVHHGNGTEAIFCGDLSVLYLSTHQWGIYPGTGAMGDIGIGEGEGSIVNIPLPAGCGDECFRVIGEEVLEPVTERFKPEILLVSAGFDAHWRDPLASLQLSMQGYRELIKRLNRLAREYCSARIGFFLEGGYDPQVLWFGVQTVFMVLGEEHVPPDPFGAARYPEPDIRPLLAEIKAIHSL